MKRILTAAIAAAAVMVASNSSQAALIGYTLVIDGNVNVPTYTLTNDSAAAQITSFSFTVGHSGRNFDYVQAITAPAGGTANLIIGDTANSGARTTSFQIDYTGFDPGEFASNNTDVDIGNITLDYRNTFFNNGAEPNSVITVDFSDGQTLSQTVADQTAGQSSYTFSQSANPVPVPAALPLLAGAVGLLGAAGWRKSRRKV